MKLIKTLPVLLLFILVSCSSISVYSDYDKKTDFNNYKTYAFSKDAVDKLQISDFDKKRILRSIDEALIAKGMTKSETPDILINLFTKENQRVDVYNYGGWGWGWGYPYWSYPYYGVGYSSVYTTPEGSLFIDFMDAKTNTLIWQGEGNGDLTKDPEQKDARIKEFVDRILEQYPPNAKTAKK